MIASNVLFLFPVIITAALHHLLIGPLTVSKFIYSVTFDDDTQSLKLAAKLPASYPHNLLLFNHNKTALLAPTILGGTIFTRYNFDPRTLNISSPRSVRQQNSNCTGDNSAALVPMTAPPYTAYGVSWPSRCGSVIDENFSQLVQSWSYDSQSAIHGAAVSPDNTVLYAADLRGNTVWAHNIDPATGRLSLRWRVSTSSNSGPRTLAPSKDGKLLYVLLEEANSLTVLNVTTNPATILPGTFSLLPAGKRPADHWANTVSVSATGKYVYASTRSRTNALGPGYISVFSTDAQGRLVERKAITATTTNVDSGNGVNSPPWSDEYVGFVNIGYTQIWMFDETKGALKMVSQLDMRDNGCCSNGVWFD